MDYKSVLKKCIGIWKLENDNGDFTEECKFYDGENQVVCQFESRENNNIVKGTSILGYSKIQNKFTYYGFNSLGRNSYQTGEYSEGKLTYKGESTYNGKVVNTRTSMIFSDDDKSFILVYEVENDGKWEIMEQTNFVRSM